MSIRKLILAAFGLNRQTEEEYEYYEDHVEEAIEDDGLIHALPAMIVLGSNVYYYYDWLCDFYKLTNLAPKLKIQIGNILEEMKAYADAELTPLMIFNTTTGQVIITSLENTSGEFKQ